MSTDVPAEAPRDATGHAAVDGNAMSGRSVLVRFYDLDQINEAAADAASGATIKPILRIG